MHRIEGLYHLSHCVGDLEEANSWYEEVLGGRLLFQNSHEEALRRASFWVVDGHLWEVLTPMDSEEGRSGPVGRFHHRFGDRMHSLGYWVEDLVASASHLHQHGIRFYDVTGQPIEVDDVRNDGVLFTHPKDTFGMVEFAGPLCTPECRIPRVTEKPPEQRGQVAVTGIRELTIAVGDLDAAAARIALVLGATESHRVESRLSRSSVLIAGDVTVEVRQPTAEQSVDSEWHRKNGDGCSGATLAVADVTAAGERLTEHGQAFWEIDSETIRLDPKSGLGISYEFTSRQGPLGS